MEAPVPASSLIHSATLVSAGIYLILRFNPLFDISFFAKFFLPIFGSFTAAYGGVCAVAQSDIKKTLAYSTISHCGFLMVLCATEINEFTILYLYIHGFFKAGVFMCVGNVLRITKGYQDTRRMGGLFKYLPFEYFMIVIGLFNLAGLPFTFGFFIKHLLLISLEKYMYIYYFILINCLVGAFAGLFYSYRLLSYTFADFKKAPKVIYITLNNISFNSFYFSGTSKASTIAISALFITSYITSYYLFKYLVFSNCQLNDFLNTTVLINYYVIQNMFAGYLLNFSYINFTVVFILSYFIFSRFRKVENYDNLISLLVYFVVFCLCTYLFIY
jgi:NADH:ubiquinone oxidoreductase subunit 5 (subunit L)/multisubunit Na+/H+ antiporter MnhA subunit